jgi:hypothetical protein
MTKPKTSKSSRLTSSALPTAPWIYIYDPLHHAEIGAALNALIPKSSLITEPTKPTLENVKSSLTLPHLRDVVPILAHCKVDDPVTVKQTIVSQYRELAISHGCNFVSVNVSYVDGEEKSGGWGTNHLEVSAGEKTAKEIAALVYKWLCEVHQPSPVDVS